MGLLPNSIEAIVREHTYHAIAGDVLLIGRQAIYLSPKEALQLVNRCGVPTPSNCVSDIAVDRTTRDRLLAYQDKELISDAAFFRLLGVNCVNALDHTSYEGAEVIHDLRYVLPDELKASADFVVDGSTLDNTFDPALTLKNLAALLRPGGRLITINMASNHREPYTIPTPLWYLDYFVITGSLIARPTLCCTCREWTALTFRTRSASISIVSKTPAKGSGPSLHHMKR